MPFNSVPGTNPTEYRWTDGVVAAANARIATCNGVATGGGAPTQLTASGWAIAIDPRDSAAAAPARPGGVHAQARYNTLGVWIRREAASDLVFEDLAAQVLASESVKHTLANGSPGARLLAMPAGMNCAIAINSDMTGDLCWLIVAMRACPTLAVAIRIGYTEKHLRVCCDMIEQLVEEQLGARVVLVTGAAPAGAAPAWANRCKTTHWHPVDIVRRSLPVGTHVESCLSTSRRLFEAAAQGALATQRSVADVACELFEDGLTERLTAPERTAIDQRIVALTTGAGALSANVGYIFLASRDEGYNHQHNTTPLRQAAVVGARGARTVITFGKPPAGGAAPGTHLDLFVNNARTDRQRAYFWAALKKQLRELGRDVVVVGGRSGTFDIAYHSGEEPTGGGLCWDIALKPARDPEVDRLQQQAGPGGLSGLSLAGLPYDNRNRGNDGAGDIAARLNQLLAGAVPGTLRNVTFADGSARSVSGAESQAMRNAEVGRNTFHIATTGGFTSAAIGGSNNIIEQVVSDAVRVEARNRGRRPVGPLPYPVSVPKPIPNRDSYKCPSCANIQQQRGKYISHRTWERH